MVNQPRTRRPSFRALINAKRSIFQSPLSRCFHVGRKWSKLSNPYPRLLLGDGTAKWRWAVRVSRKFWPYRCQSSEAPNEHRTAPQPRIGMPYFWPHLRSSFMAAKKWAKFSNPYPLLGFVGGVHRNGDGRSASPGNPGQVSADRPKSRSALSPHQSRLRIPYF